MKIVSSFITILTLLSCVFLGCNGTKEQNRHQDRETALLVFSKTLAYRHDCIEPGIAAMQDYFSKRNIITTATEDTSFFTQEKLEPFDAVLFFQTTGNVLDSVQRRAFEAWYRSGNKGFAGLHAAADSGHDWPWYGRLVGVYFAGHPPIQSHITVKADTAHRACRHLPYRWRRTDECYNYKALPEGVNVLLMLDESTYEGGTHGDVHPVSWCHEFDGGRAFYTAMGHTTESYQDPLFLEHILQGILWVCGQ